MRARNSFEPFTYYIECRKALASFTTSLALFKYFSEGNCLSLLLSRVDIFVAFRRFVRRSSNAVQNDDDVGSARQKRTENIFCSFCCCDERKRRKEKKKKTSFFGFKFETLLFLLAPPSPLSASRSGRRRLRRLRRRRRKKSLSSYQSFCIHLLVVINIHSPVNISVKKATSRN